MERSQFHLNAGDVPDKIDLEIKSFPCPNCGREFRVYKMPDWMGSDFYKDMCELKDKQLSKAYERIRELEEKLRR